MFNKSICLLLGLLYWNCLQPVWSLTVRIDLLQWSREQAVLGSWVCFFFQHLCSVDNSIHRWIQTSALAAHRRQRPIHQVSGSSRNPNHSQIEKQTSPARSLRLLTHSAVAAFRLGPCSFDLHSSMLHPASAQSAPEALTNCLYPLQNAVAALHGYKGSSPPPSTHSHPSHLSAILQPTLRQQVCVTWCLHLCCSDPTIALPRSRVFSAGGEIHTSKGCDSCIVAGLSLSDDLSLNMRQLHFILHVM